MYMEKKSGERGQKLRSRLSGRRGCDLDTDCKPIQKQLELKTGFKSLIREVQKRPIDAEHAVRSERPTDGQTDGRTPTERVRGEVGYRDALLLERLGG